MSTAIDKLEQAQLRRVPEFAPGDTVKVHFQVVEGSRRRTQVFEGVVLKRQGSGARETFTVRKQSFGVGVERTFPLHSPKIEKIDVAARGEVRRAKLYYLRDRVGKGARVRESEYAGPEEAVEPGLVNAPEPPAEAAESGEAPADAEQQADADGQAGGDSQAPEAEGDEAPESEAQAAGEAGEAPDGDAAPEADDAAAEPEAANEPDEGSGEEAPDGDADGGDPPAEEA